MGGYWPWIKNRKVRERERERHRDQRFMGVIYYIGLNDRHSPSNLCSHQLNTQINLLFSPFFFLLRKLFSPIELPNKECSHKYFLIEYKHYLLPIPTSFFLFSISSNYTHDHGHQKTFPSPAKQKIFQYFIYNYSYDHYYSII